jgi:hypothetical protein
MAPREKAAHPIVLLSAQSRDLNFRRLIIFLSSWNFAVNLAPPIQTLTVRSSLGFYT